MYFRISTHIRLIFSYLRHFIVAGKKNKGDDAAKGEEGKRQKLRDAPPVHQYSKKVKKKKTSVSEAKIILLEMQCMLFW